MNNDVLNAILNIKFEAEAGMKVGANPYASLRIIAGLARNAKQKILEDKQKEILDTDDQSNI